MPSPTAVPNPSAAAAAPEQAPEQALAAFAAAILVGPHHKQLSKDRRQLLTFLRNMHTAHERDHQSAADSCAGQDRRNVAE